MKKATNTKAKSGTLTVRLNPRARYAVDVLARVERRSISGVIQNMLAIALDADQRVRDIADKTWSPIEAERFLLMTEHFPDLLTAEEEEIVRILLLDERYRRKCKDRVDHKDRQLTRFNREDTTICRKSVLAAWNEIKERARNAGRIDI